ncbi:MAG: hypothetical protein CL797_06630 [Chromatiales bacterium]|jgi:hypothetical protein|nr:hypothetical protein [Chromatiales bacterium]
MIAGQGITVGAIHFLHMEILKLTGMSRNAKTKAIAVSRPDPCTVGNEPTNYAKNLSHYF